MDGCWARGGKDPKVESNRAKVCREQKEGMGTSKRCTDSFVKAQRAQVQLLLRAKANLLELEPFPGLI